MKIERVPLNPHIVGGPKFHAWIVWSYRKKAALGREEHEEHNPLPPYEALWQTAQALHAEALDLTSRISADDEDELFSIRWKRAHASALALIAADELSKLVNAPTNTTELFPLMQEMRAWALARSEDLIADIEGRVDSIDPRPSGGVWARWEVQWCLPRPIG